jgi:hypothetical protein
VLGKVILIITMFIDGQAQGLYTPAPVFETMEKCVATWKEQGNNVAVPGGVVRAVCVSDDEVKVVQ